MEKRVDFFNWLDRDTSLKILTYLEDPSDLVRVSSVSRSWRHFVIASGLCKKLCIKMFPCLSKVEHVIGPNSETEASGSPEWEDLKTEHKVYAFLAHCCSSVPFRLCKLVAIRASSTDNYPEESILNTLEPQDIVGRRASYWSSEGQSNPQVPETLTYRLLSDICVVSEIGVHPFRAFFQPGSPIYSPKSVRFRLGHLKSKSEQCDNYADDNFIWTYTSPEFEMAQENRLQMFELPEPVLCLGGVLQVELLGRIQRQEMDGLFYICISHVKVIGRPLSNTFSFGLPSPDKYVLKALSYTLPFSPSSSCELAYENIERLEGRERDLEALMHLLDGQGEGDVFVAQGWNVDDVLDEDNMAL